MRILGVNAVFHDPAAAVVVDGRVVAAAEEERFTRRKHGKPSTAMAGWELPERAIAWCLAEAGLRPEGLDAVTYSYDPARVVAERVGTEPGWEWLRTAYVERAPRMLATALPGLDPARVRYVSHHLAHAASAALAAPEQDTAVLVADGRGEADSHVSGLYRGGRFHPLARTELPSSLGLCYEDLTAHLGFDRGADAYKVMALASYGRPVHADALAGAIAHDGAGGFHTGPIDWSALAPPGNAAGPWGEAHADLAASVQNRLETVLLEAADWLHARTGTRQLALAGGVALNCVANTVLHDRGPFDRVWVQPAAGDAGTALGGALAVAAEDGDAIVPPRGYDLGRGFSDAQIEQALIDADIDYERCTDIAAVAGRALAEDRIVAWFQGRAEFGPRALGRRSLLAHPGPAANLDRLNAVKGRESFRPVAPMVRADRAAEIFLRGPAESPYMLFVHDVAPEWRERLAAVTHVDGTARAQTVDPGAEPLVGRVIDEFARHTGIPVIVNTSLNTAGRPIVDSPRDALECFGSAPIDLLAIGPFAVWRHGAGQGEGR